MEGFTEEHAKQFLNTEWLVKIDSVKSIPYLFKYTLSLADLSCCILLTDTKSVWAEVLNSKLLARRWRALNLLSPQPHEKTADEDAWRERTLELLSKAHTMGGMLELSFEVVDSNYSDLAFEVECEGFKWRWETCFIGHQRSSDVISKHLIFPLISLNHLTSSSAEPMSEATDIDMEKSVDKLARTARRTVDNHIKNALSKPRVATSIRRMTAMFNFVPDPKAVASVVEKPLLEVEGVKKSQPARSDNNVKEQQRVISPIRETSSAEKTSQKRERGVGVKIDQPVSQSDSATESEDESTETKKDTTTASVPASEPPQPQSLPKNQASLPLLPQRDQTLSDSESSPHRPVKKSKPATHLSSDDSESEQDKKTSRGGSTVPHPTVKKGTRQPIKRGGKRF